MIQIIYLNGPSSSGKTTLAKALQHRFDDPFLHIGIDKIIGWMPAKFNDWQGGEAPLGYSWIKEVDSSQRTVYALKVGPYAEKMTPTLREVVRTLAKMGHRLIIDDVSLGKAQVDGWREALREFSVLYIGVTAPLAILEEREERRGDRMVGSARWQADRVHRDVVYDLTIDTHGSMVEEIVETIHSIVFHPTKPAPLRQISRLGVYGIARQDRKILLIRQSKGPYGGSFDLPGGKIEFGESVERALHREFIEEVGKDFTSMEPVTNLSLTLQIPDGLLPYTFHHIALIYSVQGLHTVTTDPADLLSNEWIDLDAMSGQPLSPILLQLFKQGFFSSIKTT